MKPVNLQGHSRPIKKVKFSENGEALFTASSDRTIISWSIPKGEKLKTYTHSAAINTFCLTNKYLISGDNTGTIYIWDITNEKILKKLEHDPTLSVRSLDILSSDQSQIMIVYAGRGKLSKSFISIYNINQILIYGEVKKEEPKQIQEIINDSQNLPTSVSTAENSLNTSLSSVNTSNNNLFSFNKPTQSKPNFTQKSIYDDENSIYSIYANKPKNNPPPQNGNYNFNNPNQMNNQNNFNNPGYRFNNQQQQNNTYNFNNQNNQIGGSLYNTNNQNMNNNQGNYRFINNNMSNNFNKNNINAQNSIYGQNFQNNNMNNFNQNNSQGGFFRGINYNNINQIQNNNNMFNPNKGNSFDPNPASQTQNTTEKIVVSYEKIVPMKQIESPSNSETKFVTAKFFTYNNAVCIAVTKENGSIEFINYVSSKTIHEEKLHQEIIFDFDFDIKEKIFLTVSKDGTGCVYDFEKYSILKKFKPDNPVRFLNSCKIYKLDDSYENTVNRLNSIKTSEEGKLEENIIKINVDNLFSGDITHLKSLEIKEDEQKTTEPFNSLSKLIFVVAGGQDSKLVTTTKEGGFEIIGYILEKEYSIFSHLANFGPVNTIDVNQNKNYFASGAEDSTVKLINFDQFMLTNQTSGK